MGQSLSAGSAAARRLYDEANGLLGWDLQEISFRGPETALTETRICQPALYVHGLATLAALQEAGKAGEIFAALGLSLGEITAYAAAGVFDFATGLRVVAERGRLMQLACEQSSGAMAAIIGEDREQVAALCAEFDVEAANFNAPGQIIISGGKPAIGRAVAAARERGLKKVIPLNVAGAYHSRLMEPARAAFAEYLQGVEFRAPRFRLFSNTTGAEVAEPAALRTALVRQVVAPVRWEECLRGAVAAGATEFWELGPGGVLAGLVRRTDKAWPVKSFAEFAEVLA